MRVCKTCGASESKVKFRKWGRECVPCLNKRDAKRRSDPLRKARKAETDRLRREAYREQTFAALGGVCNRCGMTDKRCFQVHHVGHNGNDPEERKFGRNAKYALDQVLANPDAYELLCSNCHMIHHHETGTTTRIVDPVPSSPY